MIGFDKAQQNRALAYAAEHPIGSGMLRDADFFDGVMTAPFKGLWSGVRQADQLGWAALDNVVSPLAETVSKTFGVHDTSVDFFKSQRKLAEKSVRELTPDPATTGMAGQVLFSLGQIGGQAIAGSLIGGSLGAAATVGTLQGFSDYEKSHADGIDYGTAVEKALVTGAVSGASTALPMALGLRAGGVSAAAMGAALKEGGVSIGSALEQTLATQGGKVGTVAGKILGSTSRQAGKLAEIAARAAPDIGYAAGSNIALGMLERGLTANILRDAGYIEMARQHDFLDSKAMLTEAVLGVAFGGLGRFLHSHTEKMPARKVTTAQIDAALTTASHLDHEIHAAPGIPINALSSNAHYRAMQKAMTDVLAGHPVDVGDLLDGAEFLPKAPPLNLTTSSVREALGLEKKGASLRLKEDIELDALARQRLSPETLAAVSRDIEAEGQNIAQLQQTLAQQRAIVPIGSGKALAQARQQRRQAIEETERQIQTAKEKQTNQQGRLQDSLPGGRFHDAHLTLEQRQQQQERVDNDALAFFSPPKPRSHVQIERDRHTAAERIIRGDGDTGALTHDIRQAEQVVAARPDMQLHLVHPDERVSVQSAASLLEEAAREAENAHHDAHLFEVAINCFLRRA